MADTDLIARVYPYTETRREDVPAVTLKTFKTSWGCFDPLDQLPERQSRERESTEPLESQNGPVLDTLPYVELKLSDTHRSRSGFLFGWGENNDVILPKSRGVGRHHFTLTFDGEKRPIVKDWGSLNGIQVTYGSQGHGARSGFQWIVGGHEIPFVKRPIVVAALARPLVQLQIVVVPHDVASLAYIDKVDRFLQSTAAATEDLLSGLNIANRTDTKRPTGAPKLETGPIHIRKQLGKGSFASVTRYWDVSTGEEYALKKPSAEAVRARRVRIDAWRNEAHIMNLIEHPHVVKLHRSDFTQGPRLYLEYVPGGSLANKDISAAECVSILQQCLSALEYLHGSDPPIVHRDIKADNILIQYRDTNSIYVKFADFGLAKDYDNMSTICGNLGNLAPEVYENHQYIEAGGKGRVSYTEAVDVWSLGVTVYTFLCPLPRFENQYISSGTAWAKELIKMFNEDLEERPDELRRFLLEAMVVLRPEQRWSAGDCLARAMLLPVVPAMDQPETAAAVSYVSGDERLTIHYGAEPNMVQGREIPMWQPGSSENSTLSTDAGRYDRSGAPTPRASVPASAFSRKRATVPRSSSSGRHRKRQEHGSSSSSSSSSSKADASSRQQRDRVLDNRTQDSLPPVAFEDKDEDEDDWEWEEDDNARVESPHAVDHVSTSHVGQEVESHMQTFLQHQVGNGGADQEAADAAQLR
ncbi:CAMK protein kinase [Gaeumannomyces tritici R3-111a-1]|uniref:CAMK protein kinase n=1 Tax=Gaeumannomyces tritici (strain R3-111a-1) TaxID=644352 RepID=J3NTZ1_GAET3|nr:CAMK protein kinase [Gaeumannomyces tritici R3-111a-1]EJT79656.1 CAMK protein kinase [Gaeumannomyces tritici R3-111a-1]